MRSLYQDTRGSIIENVVIVAMILSVIAVGVRQLALSSRRALECEGTQILEPDGATSCRPSGGAAAVPASPSVVAQGAVCTGRGCLCLVAGTPVITEAGPRPIETIPPGTLVLARQEDDGAMAWKPILRTFVSRSRSLVRLTTRDRDGITDVLETTRNHPFNVDGSGWVDAGELVPGEDRLLDPDGWPVDLLAAESLDEQVPVFNLEIADFHTYFVGRSGVWVHNASKFSKKIRNIFRRRRPNTAVAPSVVSPPAGGAHASTTATGPAGAPPAVPRILHFYWAGGAIPPADLQNIQDWALAAGTSLPASEIYLWTTPDLGPSYQYLSRMYPSMVIKTDIDQLMVPNIETIYQNALADGAYARASDLARYTYLYRFGGIHIDTDIGPGTVDLGRPFPVPPDPNIPIIGPYIRNQEWYRKYRRRFERDYGFPPADTHELHQFIYGGAGVDHMRLNNNFMIAQRAATFFVDLQNTIVEKFQFPPTEPWSEAEEKRYVHAHSTITSHASYVTGPTPVMETLQTLDAYPSDVYELADSHWNNNVAWITPASDDPPPAAASAPALTVPAGTSTGIGTFPAGPATPGASSSSSATGIGSGSGAVTHIPAGHPDDDGPSLGGLPASCG